MFELIGQMMRLPFATLAYLMEGMAETMSGAGRTAVREGDRLRRPIDGPEAARAAPPGREEQRFATAAGTPPGGDEGSMKRGAATPGAEAKEREDRKMHDTNLSDDSVKLVHYVIVSIDRDRERILRGGEGYEIVTDNMTAEAFAGWVIARYCQRPDHDNPGEKAKKYLRVCFRVLCRWPREPLHYEQTQLDRLDSIERAIRGEGRTENDERRIAEERRQQEEREKEREEAERREKERRDREKAAPGKGGPA